ncbi:MAG: MmgE/PrpD family protein [Xanthobacteraceae bacterium]
MTALETFGNFVAHGVRNRLSPETRAAARLHAIDTVAAWIAASRTAEAQQIARSAPLVAEGSSGAMLDIVLNCARVRMSEVDDIHLGAMITPGSFIVPAALSIAASLPRPDALALNEAIICGYEAMVRLGLAVDGPTILYRGIWPSLFAAPFGVAAVAARLLELTAPQAANALAFALTLAAPGVGGPSGTTTTRWLAAGANARHGLFAARAALAGFTSDTGLFEGPFLKNVYNVSPNAAALTDGLGDHLAIADVSFKPWCAARQTMAATQALKEIVASGVDVTSISSIEVAVPPPFLRMVDHGISEFDRMSRLTSVQYQIAAALLDPDSAYDVGQTSKVSADVLELMAKITVTTDDSLLREFPKVWPARVVANAPGKRHERIAAHVPGDPGRPFSSSDVNAKFHRLADRLIGKAIVDRLIATTDRVLDGSMPAAQLLSEIARETAG